MVSEKISFDFSKERMEADETECMKEKSKEIFSETMYDQIKKHPRIKQSCDVSDLNKKSSSDHLKKYEEKKYSCKICMKKFHYKQNLKRHSKVWVKKVDLYFSIFLLKPILLA